MSVPPYTKLDYEQVITRVYDESENRLRTDAVVSPSGGFEIVIDHTNDSIAIGTSTDLFTSTTIGPSIGLDTNIINTVTVQGVDIDIRNLSFSDDKVDVSGSLVGITGSVAVTQSTSPWITEDKIYSNTGTITGSGQTVQITGNNFSTVGLLVTGTWIGTLSFEQSDDGSNWVSIYGVPDTGAITTSIAANGTWHFSVGGSYLRVRSPVWTSGTANIFLTAKPGVNVVEVISSNAVNLATSAAQLGTWNITNITGTVSLPTGASTAALQTTGNTSLASIDSKLNTLGQKTSSGSVPVVIASDQTVPVSGSLTISTISNPVTVVGPAADGAAVSGNPVRIAGKDLSGNTQDIITDTTGRIWPFTGFVSTSNSRANSSLGSGATFTGTFEDVTQYAGFSLGILDAGAAGGTLTINWSEDGVTTRDTDTVAVPTSNGQQFTWGRKWQFFQVSYTHGAAAGNVVIQTILHTGSIIPSTHFGSDTITTGQAGQLVIAANRVLNGTTFLNQTGDSSGNAFSSSKIPLTASSPTAATVGVASAQAVASNANRKGLVLTNTSANTISFGLGATAVLNSGITLPSGFSWVMDEYTFTTAAINAIAAAGSSNLAIQEFT